MKRIPINRILKTRLLAALTVLAAIIMSNGVAIIGAEYQNQRALEKYVGHYDAVLETPGGQLEFGLAISTNKPDGPKARIFNGPAETIFIKEISADEDGLLISFGHYDSAIRATRDSEGGLSGNWKKRRANDEWVELKFSAAKVTRDHPFSLHPGTANGINLDKAFYGKNVHPFHGRWKVDFSSSDEPAVALFGPPKLAALAANDKPFNYHRPLFGTFMTTTGDYRFLAGNSTDGKSATLSCFDGAHAFLFKMTLKAPDRLTGDFWSSDTWHETWTATRDANAKLPDAFAQTTATDTKLTDLSFPDLDGKLTSLNDEKFQAPARIVYLFGTWCPNCHDAAAYFSKLQKLESSGNKVSIVGLAFEVSDDHERNATQVRKYLARHGCTYPVLIAGPSNKKLATKAFPLLDKVRSYPTTIFLDAEGNVQAIHTGFTGPATGDDFIELDTKFRQQIESIWQSPANESREKYSPTK